MNSLNLEGIQGSMVADFVSPQKLEGHSLPKLETSSNRAMELSANHVTESVNDLNQVMQQNASQLRFEFDENSERSVIKLIDPKEGEVIRQFPTQSFLAQSERIKAYLKTVFDADEPRDSAWIGGLLDEKV